MTALLPPGTIVRKISGKPFKSGAKTATVKAVVPHPYLPEIDGYTFEEDDSVVRASYCEAVRPTQIYHMHLETCVQCRRMTGQRCDEGNRLRDAALEWIVAPIPSPTAG